jgi:hypothetical protein
LADKDWEEALSHQQLWIYLASGNNKRDKTLPIAEVLGLGVAFYNSG